MTSLVRLRFRPSAASSGAVLVALVTLVSLLGACDPGDDTVHPFETPGGSAGGGAGGGGGAPPGSAGNAANAGNAGNAGGSGSTAGAGGAGAGGAAGLAGGAAGLAGGSGTSGAAGASGASGGAGGTNPGGSAGGSSSGGEGGGGDSNAGSGGAPVSEYAAACGAFEGALQKCGTLPEATVAAGGTACRDAEACADTLYDPSTAALVLACAGTSCEVPSYLDQTISACLGDDQMFAPDSRVAYKQLIAELTDASSGCEKLGDKASPGVILKVAVSGIPHGMRPAIYQDLHACVAQPCEQVGPCIVDRMAAICAGPKFFWPSSAYSVQAGTD
jgi:hypothetical protein